jgi:Co/Zn/Cd efflux system component
MFGMLLVLGIAAIANAAIYTFTWRIADPVVAAFVALVCTVATSVFNEVVTASAYTALSASGSGFGGRRLAEVF